MIINPQNDCTWSYVDGKLVINLTVDDGSSWQLDTLYKIDELDQKPENNSPFCVEDACLLTDYQDGIGELIADEGAALAIGLRAVACQRFVKVAHPYSRFFEIHNEKRITPKRGMVVNVYTKTGNYGNCVVLDNCDADGLVRLMLLNEELELVQDRGFSNGMMIRLSPEYICEYSYVPRRRAYA